MSNTPGSPSRIGSYPIEREIGRGGMGIVYLATDPRLGRPVAIKVLPDVFSGDPERLARFEREARLLASLSHPNIAGIYGLEEAEGRRFLALEYVEGETLAERIARGPLPVDDAIDVCRQIAAALEAAHESGVIHRDLKPGNVKLTPTGEVKVLDFGLAKGGTGSGGASGPQLSESPTLALSVTEAGVVLGTAAYMSPEQARGKAVDRRTDIWSFGCVLYECLTGGQAFAGETISDVVAMILQGSPDWSALPRSLPANLRELLERCLAKDPKKRLRDIGEARLVLEGGAAAPVSSVSAAPAGTGGARARPPWLLYGLLVALIASTAALAWRVVAGGGRSGPVTRLAVPAPPGLIGVRDAVDAAMSPDGTMIAMVCSDSTGNTSVWLRPLDSIVARELPGTRGGVVPFWSPDSRTIGFFTADRLKRVSVDGGNPVTICPVQGYGRGGTWGTGGDIVFAAGGEGPLSRVAADGGPIRPVTALDSTETGHRFPEFLPDGRHFLYASLPPRAGEFDIYVGTLDGPGRERLMTAEGTPDYVEPGYLLYTRNGRVVAQRFDPRARRLRGSPITLRDEPGPTNWLGRNLLSASGNGAWCYVQLPRVNTDLVWFGASGRRLSRVPVQEGQYESVALSPDDSRAAVVLRSSASESDVWIVDLARGTMSRLTFGPGRVTNPVWSPDGSRIAFASDRAGRWDIYAQAASGAAPPESLLAGGSLLKFPLDWSRDGHTLLYQQLDEKYGWDLWALPMEGDRTPKPYVRAPFDQLDAKFSPDGRWVAYQSSESGRPEIYVQAFPTPARKHQVSVDGGAGPRWRNDGREIAFTTAGQTIMFVDVGLDKGFSAGIPRPAFPISNTVDGDVTSDFSRFLVLVPAGEANPAATLVVVENWRQELNKR